MKTTKKEYNNFLNPIDKVMYAAERANQFTNLSLTLKLTGTLKIEKFKLYVKNLPELFPFLKYNVRVDEKFKSAWYVKNQDYDQNIDFIYEDLHKKTSINKEIENRIKTFNNLNIDPENGPVIRINLVKIKSNSYLLMIGISHTFFDATGFLVFIKDFITKFNEFSQSQKPEKSNFFFNNKILKKLTKGASIKNRIKWFTETLKWLFKNRKIIDIFGKKIHPYGTNHNHFIVKLTKDQTAEVIKKAKKHNCTVSNVIFTVGAYALNEANKNAKIKKENLIINYSVDLRRRVKGYNDAFANLSTNLNIILTPKDCKNFDKLLKNIKLQHQYNLKNRIPLLSWKLSVKTGKVANINCLINQVSNNSPKLDPNKSFIISNIGKIDDYLLPFTGCSITECFLSANIPTLLTTYKDQMIFSMPLLVDNNLDDPRQSFYNEFKDTILKLNRI